MVYAALKSIALENTSNINNEKPKNNVKDLTVITFMSLPEQHSGFSLDNKTNAEEEQKSPFGLFQFIRLGGYMTHKNTEFYETFDKLFEQEKKYLSDLLLWQNLKTNGSSNDKSTNKQNEKDEETSDEDSDDKLPPLEPLPNTSSASVESSEQKTNDVTKDSLNAQADEIKKTQEKLKSFSFYKVYEFIKMQHDAAYAPSPHYYTDADLVRSVMPL
jgi:hypothetical protein